MKKEVYFDGNTIESIVEFHEEMARLLSFPSYYQHNLDDLWTCLTSYINPNIRLIIQGTNSIYQVFQSESVGLQDIFERLPGSCPEIDLILID